METFAGQSHAYTFTVFTLPAGSLPPGDTPIAVGLNDLGEVVGNGFIDNHGTITAVNVPIAVTQPLAINNLSQVVGSFTKSDGGHAFLDTNGTFTYFALGSAAINAGEATGINDRGQVVGQYTGYDFPGGVRTITEQFGFIDTNGTISHLSLANGMAFLPTGINDFDQVVGATTSGVSGVLDLRIDRFTPIKVPGATSVDASAINNLGQVAGTYTDGAGNVHAFVDTGGRMTFLNLPPSLPGTLQAVTSINDFDQIVGQFIDAGGVMESFIATPQHLTDLTGHHVPDTEPVRAGGFAWGQHIEVRDAGAIPQRGHW
jgi:probable HAF family extracellular repeat protein